MKKQVLIFCIISFMVLFIASTPVSQQVKSSIDQELQKIVKKVDSNGWVYFKDNFKPNPKKFFSDYKKDFKLSKYDEMRLTKEGSDSIFKYYRFDRYYKGILVEGSGKTLKYKNDDLILVIGRPIYGLDIDINNIVDPEIAFKEAKKSMAATKFAWEDYYWESTIRKEKDDSSATWLPKGRLVIAKNVKGEFRLAYTFDILSIQPKFDHSIQYIDAQTGYFLREKPLSFNATSPGITHYNEQQTLTTYYQSGHWWLQDLTRYIYAKSNQYPSDIDWNNYPWLQDWDNFWDWLSERSAVSSQWAAERSYDYFHVKFGRHGTDGNNRAIYIAAEHPYDQSGYEVQYGTHDFMYFGYKNSLSLAALDIVGHEFMHGVTAYINGISNMLEYTYAESGALNESYSDFFGECVEDYTDGPCNWLFGADVGTIRSMILPSYRNQPNYYHDANWYYGTDVSTYVHTNSGVPNRMFYILSHGDTGLGITGIGISYAATIAYNSLDWYLDSDATFSEARDAFLDVALNYGNQCYYLYKGVMNAWAAVGIGSPAPNPCVLPLEAYISGPESASCGECLQWNANVTGGSGNYSYQWYVNSINASTSSYLYYCFPQYQSDYYTIRLLVTDGSQSALDMIYLNVGCYYGMVQPEYSLSLFPNPASDHITLEILENEDSQTKLKDKECLVYGIDKIGREFYKIKTKNRKVEINVSNLQEGTYTIITVIGDYKSYVNFSIAR